MPIDVRFDEDKELLHITLSGAWPTLADGQRSVRMQVDWMRVYAPAA